MPDMPMATPEDVAQASPARPWLSILGIGEEGVDGLSPAARQRIAAAALVVGGARHLALAAPLIRGETLAWRSPIAETFPQILARRGQPVVVLASGDPSWFGVGSRIAHLVPEAGREILPHASALGLACARLGWPAQDVTTVTLCGRPLETVRPHLAAGARLIVLSAGAETPPALAGYLCRLGFGPSRLHVLEALGGPHARHRTMTAEAFALDDIQALNLVAVEAVAAAEALALGCVPGRPEALFDHDGQITKAEVRAITLASLQPRPGARLWDIGCGSGAVSIEWLLACPAAHASAVDQRADRLDRALSNAHALGVPRLEGCVGAAPAVFADLPPPDAVFLGGGAGDPAVLQGAWDALPGDGRLVANAVTLETQAVLMDAYRRLGGRLVRIALDRAEPVGRLHGFRPAMPVLHYAVQKPAVSCSTGDASTAGASKAGASGAGATEDTG